MGLSSKAAAEMAESVLTRSVRQLSGLARRSAPVVGISASCNASNGRKPRAGDYLLEYHEVLSAAFGHQVEENKLTLSRSTKGSMC